MEKIGEIEIDTAKAVKTENNDDHNSSSVDDSPEPISYTPTNANNNINLKSKHRLSKFAMNL